jgi:hypothetical protein
VKKLLIVVAGTEGQKEFKDIQILPGTRARDILAKLGLKGFQLARPEGGAFADNDDLFPLVSDGQKLFASKSDVEAGRVVRC